MKQNEKNSFYMKDNLHVAGIHTALDIWRFAVFLDDKICISVWFFSPTFSSYFSPSEYSKCGCEKLQINLSELSIYHIKINY